MPNSLLVDITPEHDEPTRRAILQQWYENMALVFKGDSGSTYPTTGGYLIDSVGFEDVRETRDCATVAWVKNAANQV